MIDKRVKFIGDLSMQDAEVLRHYSAEAKSILEFGVGGSTQIMAQTTKGNLLSLETSQIWTEATQRRLKKLGVNNFQIMPFEEWPEEGVFDLIFDDGIDRLRRGFAIKSFPLLTVGGHFIFHDTRRLRDVCNLTHLIETYHEEIEDVYMNQWHSNMTVVRKKAKEVYVNWQKEEGKPEWMYGAGKEPDAFWYPQFI